MYNNGDLEQAALGDGDDRHEQVLRPGKADQQGDSDIRRSARQVKLT